MFLKAFLLAFLVSVVVGCALPIPAHEGQPPAAVGKGAIRLTGGFAEDPQEALAINSDTAYNPESEWLPGFTEYFGITLGVADRLDLYVEMDIAVSLGMAYKVGIKFQEAGNPIFKAKSGEFQTSTAIRYVTSSGRGFTTEEDLFDLTTRDIYYDTLSAKGVEVAQSFGMAVTEWFTVYGGAKYLYAKLQGDFRIGGSGAALQSGSRILNMYGPFFGLVLFPHWKRIGLELLVEAYFLHMPATYQPHDTWFWGWGSSLGIPIQIF